MSLDISLIIGGNIGLVQMVESMHSSEVVNDRIAEKLEMQGLWRRAAARWLKVMNSFEHTDLQREWIRRRCKYCCAKLTPLERPVNERLDIASVSRAASIAQEKMGINQTVNNRFIFNTHKGK